MLWFKRLKNIPHFFKIWILAVILLGISSLFRLFISIEIIKEFAFFPAFTLFAFPLEILLLLVFSWIFAYGAIFLSRNLNKNGSRISISALNITLLLIFIIISTLIVIPFVTPYSDKVNSFVADNKNLNLTQYVGAVTEFQANNLKFTENIGLKMDVLLTPIDYYLLGLFGVDQTDIIVFQGWGSCSDSATLIQSLLSQAGYEARQAQFINWDHQWAEVLYNGSWQIIDPWDIGTFHPINNLNISFPKATGVKVIYPNGTVLDSSVEHGFIVK